MKKMVIQGLDETVLPLPGRAISSGVQSDHRPSRVMKGLDFDQTAAYLRSDYRYASRLPTDAARMRAHLYTGLTPGREADGEAWNRAGDFLQGYLPPAQQAALLRALATIPGVTVLPQTEDRLGRPGTRVSRTEYGIREEYLFAPDTSTFLEQRSVVVRSGAQLADTMPKGSISYAMTVLGVTVSPTAPNPGELPPR